MPRFQKVMSRALATRRTSWRQRVGSTVVLSLLCLVCGTVGSAWAAGGSGGAGSGYYTVGACADGDGSTDGWTDYNTNDQALTAFADGCTSLTGGQYNGLAAQTNNYQYGAQPGQKAGWAFEAPSGTTLGDVELWYDAGVADAGFGWFITDTAGHLDSCVEPSGGGTVSCDGGQTSDSWNLSGTNQTFISTYVGCSVSCPGPAGTGNFIDLNGASVQVDESTSPSVGSLSGPASGGWVTGGATVAFSVPASDTSGIMQQTLLVDGNVSQTTSNGCNWNTPVPCPNVTSSFSVTASNLGQGCHNVSISVMNAAGLSTTSGPDTVCVSSVSPQAPTITSATAGTSTVNLTWTDPSNDPAPIANTLYTLNGGAAEEVAGDPQALTLSGLAPGSYAVCVWLQDAAGNADASSPACSTVAIAAPVVASTPTGTTTTPTTSTTTTPTTTTPGTTTVPVPTTSGTVRHVDVKLTVGFTYRGAATSLHEIGIGRLPKGTELTVTYNPHRRGHKATVKRATTAAGLKAVIRFLRGTTYRPGQTLNLNLTRRGYVHEWATFTFRSGKLPTVRPVKKTTKKKATTKRRT